MDGRHLHRREQAHTREERELLGGGPGDQRRELEAGIEADAYQRPLGHHERHRGGEAIAALSPVGVPQKDHLFGTEADMDEPAAVGGSDGREPHPGDIDRREPGLDGDHLATEDRLGADDPRYPAHRPDG